jgi:hypothetical protein
MAGGDVGREPRFVTADRSEASPAPVRLSTAPAVAGNRPGVLVIATAASAGAPAFVGATAGTDRLTVPTTWLTSGLVAAVTPRSAGVVTDVTTSAAVLVTGVTGIPLTGDDVDVGRREAGMGCVLAGSTDVARAGVEEERPVTGAAFAEPASTVDRTNAKNMPAKMAMTRNASRRNLRSRTGRSMPEGSPGIFGSRMITC